MIQFTLGIALAIFALIVGSYQYLENENIISRQKYRIVEIDRQKVEAQQMQVRLRRISDKLMPRGEDQRANIEKLLGLEDTKLTFRFLTQANPTDPGSRFFYRHDFEISGSIDYFKGMQMINRADNLPGTVLYQACFNCTRLSGSRSQQETSQNEQILLIKGYLYVHNPDGGANG